MNEGIAYIHREKDPDYPGSYLYVPRNARGEQIAMHSPDWDTAHDNANDEGYFNTEDVTAPILVARFE